MVILRRKARKGRIHQDREQKLRVNTETKVQRVETLDGWEKKKKKNRINSDESSIDLVIIQRL